MSVGVHAGVLGTFAAWDVLPWGGGPIAAHTSDDVSVAIHLAPSAEPVPEAATEPVEAAAMPEPEPTAASEPAPETMPSVTPLDPVPEVVPPRPAPAPKPAWTGPTTSLLESRRPTPGVESPRTKQPSPRAAAPERMTAGFAGVRVKQARRIVYAVDVSGAMAASLDSVLLELRRSVGRLGADQQFQIVLFRETLSGEAQTRVLADASGGATMQNAGSEAKLRVDAFLRTAAPGGRSAPLAGLRRALEFAPDVVFLLTSNIRRSDSSAAEQARILAELDRLNPRSAVTGRRPVTIRCLQFVHDDPTGLLQQIARVHGDSSPDSYVLLKVGDLGNP